MKTYFPFIRKMFVLSSMAACNSNVQRMQESEKDVKIIRPKDYNFDEILNDVNNFSDIKDLQNSRLISKEWDRVAMEYDFLKHRFFRIHKLAYKPYKLFTNRISQAEELGAKNIDYYGNDEGLEEVVNKISSLKALRASIHAAHREEGISLKPIVMGLGRHSELIHLELGKAGPPEVSGNNEGTEFLSQLPFSLTHLSIINLCRINKKGVEAIATLTNLKELHLSYVHGEVISLSNLKGLETLSLHKFGGVSSEELQVLCSLPELKELDIRFIAVDCGEEHIHPIDIFTDKAIQCLENLKNLTSLRINPLQFNERGRAILLDLKQKRKNLQITDVMGVEW